MSLIVNNYYPLDYLVLAGIDQPQPADPRTFWSSDAVLPPAAETLTFDLGNTRPINCISFEIIGKPIDLDIEWFDGTSWNPITDNPDFNNEQSTTYLGGENPWIFIERHFLTVQAQQIRITFTRRTDPFPFSNSDLFAWTVDVRNTRLLYLVDSVDDYIDDAGTDILGNSFRTQLYPYSPTNMTDGDTDTYWKSFPHTDPKAVESVYLDLRDDAGDPIVIDEVYIDPITYGPFMHMYYSNDDSTDVWDTKLWTPIPRHYILKKGYHALPAPATLKYLKLEFSNLTPTPYNLSEYPSFPSFTYNRFPTWVQSYFQNIYNGINNLGDLVGVTDTINIDPLGLGFTIPNDMLSKTELDSTFPTDPAQELKDFVQGVVVQQGQIPEAQQELESQISFRNSFQWQDDLTNQMNQDRALTRLALEMAGSSSIFQTEDAVPTLAPPSVQSVPDLSQAQADKFAPIMWFPMTCRHAYQVVRTHRTDKIAYYVGIREVGVFRNTYNTVGDPESYVETLGDALNVRENDFIQSDNYWIVGSALLTGTSTFIQRGVSRVRKIRTKTQNALAHIQLGNNSVTQTAKANIQVPKTKAQTSKASISIHGTRTQPAKANITTGGGTTTPNWNWDATTATVHTNSAAMVSSFIQYAPLTSGNASFFIEIGYGQVTSHTTGVYSISTAGKPGSMDATIWIPTGQLGGLSNDQHLLIEDTVTGRWHDFDGVTFSGGKVASWNFGKSMPIGVVNIGGSITGKTKQGATAACFPLRQGIITPAEVQSGVIPHALVITAANLGASPNPYPATSWSGGYSSANITTLPWSSTNLPLGTWMRLPASATISSSATNFEKMIFTALKQYGLFIRDRGSTVTFHGLDDGGGGSSISSWQAAGAAIGSTGTLTLHNIPWTQLQVLNPPPYSGGDPGESYPPL